MTHGKVYDQGKILYKGFDSWILQYFMQHQTFNSQQTYDDSKILRVYPTMSGRNGINWS